MFAQSAAMGGLPILRAATDPDAAGGAYFGRAAGPDDRLPVRPVLGPVLRPVLQQRLWPSPSG